MPRGSSSSSGSVPKRASQRRRRNKPASYGAATAEVAGAATAAPQSLGFEAHALIESLWGSLQGGPEARYYSAADWDRLRLELVLANKMISNEERPPATAWKTFQDAMNTLLVSPAEKRRLGIELTRAASDPDEDAAIAQLDDYRKALGN